MFQQIAAASLEAHKIRQDRFMSNSLLSLLNDLIQSVPTSPMEDQRVKALLKAENELYSYQTRLAETNGVPSADMIVGRDAAREKYIKLSRGLIQWSKRNNEWEPLLHKCATDLRSLQYAWRQLEQGMV